MHAMMACIGTLSSTPDREPCKLANWLRTRLLAPPRILIYTVTFFATARRVVLNFIKDTEQIHASH